MKIFTCAACKNVVFFENSQCVRCGHQLAFLSDSELLSAVEQTDNAPDGSARFVALDSGAKSKTYKLCQNYATYAVCNWALPAEDSHDFCLACRLNETIPNLSASNAVDAWRKLEVAKRRLVYTLTALHLPVEGREQSVAGLAFSFLEDGQDGERVLTGHCDGMVTINVKEADTTTREQTREKLGERYRTLLGHFRHESGHYYWDRLVRDSTRLQRFRELFGDEQLDYAEAVKKHYASPRTDWINEFVSTYATMHPWEDWAETWAHYLHMIDTLDTAQSYGLALKPRAVGGARTESVSARRVQFDDFNELIAAWYPLTLALNSLNRSMGLSDLYPFVLPDRVVEKLAFVHEVVEAAAAGDLPVLPAAAPAPAQPDAPQPFAPIEGSTGEATQSGAAPENQPVSPA